MSRDLGMCHVVLRWLSVLNVFQSDFSCTVNLSFDQEIYQLENHSVWLFRRDVFVSRPHGFVIDYFHFVVLHFGPKVLRDAALWWQSLQISHPFYFSNSEMFPLHLRPFRETIVQSEKQVRLNVFPVFVEYSIQVHFR